VELKDKSPFLPPDHDQPVAAPKAVAQVNGPISREVEFRGFITINGKNRFSIYNKAEQRSLWIAENQTVDSISLSNFNPDAMTVIIRKDGRSEQLQLISSSDAPIPVAVSQTAQTTSANKPTLPPGLTTNKPAASNTQVQRRRVILPKR